MKAIHANPRTVRKIFQDEYIIPEYQRPYTWDEEKCMRLWDDLKGFWEDMQDGKSKNSSENYFLGTVTFYKDSNDTSFSIVDGQQRLISLSLLIKALYGVAGTHNILRKCLVRIDPLSDDPLNDPRIESRVLETDNEEFRRAILPNSGTWSGNSRFKKNYEVFEEAIRAWHDKNFSTDNLESLIKTFLDQVTLLPVECGSQDDALTIFETLNDRGTPLNDTDIFKVKIYQSAPSKEEFLQSWNALEDHRRLFTIYMHLLRAEKGDTSKEIALRRYFDKQSILKNYDSVMSVLQKLDRINQGQWNIPGSIQKWWKILQFYPNDYWQYPLYVFLHKHASNQWDEDGNLKIEEDSDLAEKLETLIKATVKYFYIKGVNHNSVNVVRDTTFRICKNIYNDEEYIKEYKDNLQRENINEFKDFARNIEESRLRRYLKGILLVGANLNKEQDGEKFRDILELPSPKIHIEHILPRSWHHYDGWTQKTHLDDIDKLGNLVPCESKINISASDEFFLRKQEKYKESKVQDVLDLSEQEPTWSPATLEDRHNKIVKRITDFFCNF